MSSIRHVSSIDFLCLEKLFVSVSLTQMAEIFRGHVSSIDFSGIQAKNNGPF